MRSEIGISRLLLILMAMLPLCVRAQQMPPYPDVWEMQFSNPAPGSSLHASLLGDGQVVIAYSPEGPGGKAPSVEKLFFGGGEVQRKKLPDGQYQYAHSDGRHAVVVRRDSYREMLSSGRVIRNAYNHYRNCYRGPAREYVVVTSEDRRLQLRKVFFYLLDEPQRFVTSANDNWRGLETGSSCPTEPSLDLGVRVQSIGGSFLALPDGSILFLVHQHGLVLRLTQNLDSHSKLMNDRVFAFAYQDSYLFVDLLFGKDYGNGEEQSIRFQDALDDLRDHLLEIKNEKPGAASSARLAGDQIVERSSDSCRRNESGIFEDITCALAAKDAADRELNDVYKKLLARLRPSEEKLLRQAQRDWLEFVEADAKFTLEHEGGSAGRLIVVNSRETLTRERIEALKSWLP